ncbi:hypothetical protein [Microvirga calopogonii]|uniref:hypothetical protein n=1 Tax=Microvirga calopogonii TaxID=2078013 RepID=UPI000E0DF597|nr:hypothetical protein [Microvirga calopogonii]
MDTKREFQVLYRRLRLPAAAVAAITGRSVNTVRHYLSSAVGSRIPGEDVIVAMRAAWREKAKVSLVELVEHLRDDGVEIDWASLEPSGPVEVTFIRPAFLAA